MRTLTNLVTGRLKWFDRHIDWRDKAVLDLGCAGGFMADAVANGGAERTGINLAAESISAARTHSKSHDFANIFDVVVGEARLYTDARFDAVACVDVLEQVADLAKIL